MEKCTFCLQRIRRAEKQALVEGRPVRDGEVVPACVQTCPTSALLFGDLNDPGSQVGKLLENNSRKFKLLEHLGTEPAVYYLKGGIPMSEADTDHVGAVHEPSSSRPHDHPIWRQPLPEDEELAHQVEHQRQRHLLLDPRYPLESGRMVLEPMYRTGRRFWLVFVILAGLVAMYGGTWLYQMYWGSASRVKPGRSCGRCTSSAWCISSALATPGPLFPPPCACSRSSGDGRSAVRPNW